MTIQIDKYIVKDIMSIMFEDKEARITQVYGGHRFDIDALTREDLIYIGRLMYESYIKGAQRTIEMLNRNEERKAQQAQKRALDKILKGEYW